MARNDYKKRRNGKKNTDHDVLGISLVVISLFLLLCIIIPPILSVVSRGVFSILLGVFGIVSYPLLLALLLLGICLLLRRVIYTSVKNVVCITLISFFALIILQLASTHAFLKQSFGAYIGDVYAAKYSAGGVIFGVIAFGLKTALTEIGCYVIFSVALLAAVAVLVNLPARLRALKNPVTPPSPDAVTVGPPPRTFTSETEAQQVVGVSTDKNSLFIGSISKKEQPVVKTESGKASKLPPESRRAVTDYAPSPVVERSAEAPRRYTSSEDARYALYGDADAINERSIEEFTKKQDEKVEKKPEPVEVKDVTAQAVVEPYIRVSEDAHAARPKRIEHVDTPDMQVVFPAPKKYEFNDEDIISADDLASKLRADAQKRRQQDIEGAEPPARHSIGLRDYSPFTGAADQIDDIYTVPEVKTEPQSPTTFGDYSPPAPSVEDRFLSAREEERSIIEPEPVKQEEPEQDDIIDAFALRNMYAAEEKKSEPVRDDIITDAVNPAPTPAPALRFKPIDFGDDGIIDAAEPVDAPSAPFEADDGIIDSSKPLAATNVRGGIIDGSLVISDEPAVDLSETHDNTSDLIAGEDLSGMYVSADEEQPVAPKPRQSKKNIPLDNQITFDNILKEQADDSVVMPERSRRKKYDYSPPPIDLLKTYDAAEMSADDMQSIAATLETVVGGFLKTEVKVINIVHGPTVTRYELELPSGVSVKQVGARAQDIEYELATPSHIRIEAPIPGKRAVGIEVPNYKRSIVGLREIVESPDFNKAKSAMTASVGKDISGGVVLCDLVKIPHLLIAGQTGSGKSACLNGLLISLLYKSSPEDLRFILIDPKRVEFSAYRGMPHLLFNNIIYEPNEVLNALKWAAGEMERRYALMAKYSRNQLSSFNELPDVQSGKIDKLPHIIIVIDELADIMQSVVKREIEEKIKVIAAKARAAGIHLIVATQRPSSDVITGTIKTNLTSRIAFRVSSQVDARVILDTAGAEALVGNGDMLFFPVDYTSPKRVQGSYISDAEVVSVIQYIKEHYECDFDEEASNAVFNTGGSGNGAGGANGGDANKDDPLLPDVLAMIIKSGQASTSGIQRRFSIGYARAARIMDLLEELNYIGPSTGSSKPRDVLVTAEKYREMFGRDVEEG